MRSLPKDIVVIVVALIAGIYMLNPTAGFDFIPDLVPVFGNLDEATAMALLIAAAHYFGFDISRFFGRRGQQENVVSGQATRQQPQ
ncbi:MAG: DUF1232 domain-containing protein [Burkholderiales bacterium]|nr:DUF1232 domain-containing protein [Anaerolineae bacterium]